MTLYSPRVKRYAYNDTGWIVSTAGSLLFGSTTHPIDGEITKITYNAANFTTGGSIWLQIQDDNVIENLGSVAANLNVDSVVYPGKAPQAGTGVIQPPVAGHVFYSGIGVGGTLSGQLVFYYR